MLYTPTASQSIPNTYRTEKHILIVEDSNAIYKLLDLVLKREGFKTSIATTVPMAKEILKEQMYDFDLILLDLNLPGGTGFEVLQVIREHSTTPVLILSALKQNTNVERGLSLGAEDFITKPFNPRELILRIRKQIAPD